VVEHVHLHRAGVLPHQPRDVAVVHRAHLRRVVEVRHDAVVLDQREALAVEREVRRVRPAVPDEHRALVHRREARRRVGRRGVGIHERLGLDRLQVVQRGDQRLDAEDRAQIGGGAGQCRAHLITPLWSDAP